MKPLLGLLLAFLVVPDCFASAKQIALAAKVIASQTAVKKTDVQRVSVITGSRDVAVVRSKRKEGCSDLRIASPERMNGVRNEINVVTRDITVICR